MPVLNAIKMSGLTDALVVVTRYFGGILLGAGGLVRAYSTCASMALEAGGIKVYEDYNEYSVKIPYADYSKFSIELTAFNAIIDDTNFSEDISITFAIKQDESEKFEKRITDLFNGKISLNYKKTRIDTK